MGYLASYRFENRFPICICTARGFERYWGENLKSQWKMVNYFDGKFGLPVFVLATANDSLTCVLKGGRWLDSDDEVHNT